VSSFADDYTGFKDCDISVGFLKFTDRRKNQQQPKSPNNP
jgi:hypothetical protein